MHYKTIFISDIHIGTIQCSAEKLNFFLKENTSDKLIIVGDALDIWAMKRGLYLPKEQVKLIKNIFKRAKTSEVIYILGNHEEYIRSIVPFEISGIKILDEYIHDGVNGKKYLVTHGDIFDGSLLAGWVIKLGDIGYTILVKSNIYVNKIRKLFGYVGHWSLSKFMKKHVKQAVTFINNFEDVATHEAKKRGYSGLILGHIHTAANKEINGIEYFNCGDCCESCTALVETTEGYFSILDF